MTASFNRFLNAHLPCGQSALFLKISFLTQILRGDLGARLGALGLKAGLCDRAGG